MSYVRRNFPKKHKNLPAKYSNNDNHEIKIEIIESDLRFSFSEHHSIIAKWLQNYNISVQQKSFEQNQQLYSRTESIVCYKKDSFREAKSRGLTTTTP